MVFIHKQDIGTLKMEMESVCEMSVFERLDTAVSLGRLC
jgi:hypothetical protein